MSLGVSSVNRCFADVTLLDVTLCLVRFFHIADVTLLDVKVCLVGKPLFRGCHFARCHFAYGGIDTQAQAVVQFKVP